MKIIVTGASGFVGQNLIEYLEKNGCTIYPLSVRNENWIRNIDNNANAIVHLAGKAHDTSNISSEDEYFKVNRDITINIFNFFLRSNINDFFYFSSVKAVADTLEDVLSEDIQGSPVTPYGKSKLEAEQYLLSRSLPEGKRLFIIRPCMIHGPGNKGNLNLLYKVVETGFPWPLAAFQNERSFLGIDNLAFLVFEMMRRRQVPSGIYNFADDETISTNDLVRLIAQTLGKKPKLWSLPAGLIQLVAKVGDIIPFPLNVERLKKLTESYVVSNLKIKQALGLNGLPMSMRQGIEKTIRSFNNKEFTK